MNHHTIDLPLHLLQCRRNSKYLNNFMAFCVPEMRGKRKAKCSFASAKSKAPYLLMGSLSPAPRVAGAAPSSSLWIHEVHREGSCPLLLQEIPLWVTLQLTPSCRPG